MQVHDLLAVNLTWRLTPAYRYTHDSECVMYHGPDKAYHGHEICFNYNEGEQSFLPPSLLFDVSFHLSRDLLFSPDTLTVVDVTDKEHMKMLSRTGYEGAKYTHQVRCEPLALKRGWVSWIIRCKHVVHYSLHCSYYLPVFLCFFCFSRDG